jgi:hypothetical protein
VVVAAVLVGGVATMVLSGSARGKQAGGISVAAARQQAAAWVASQVNSHAIVACDPAMCAALRARGMRAGRLLVLTPARSDPFSSNLVVATSAVRSEFGARLRDVYAPATLATFGSGPARVELRLVAADGAASYRRQLAADVRERKAAGARLLHNSRLHIAAAARDALAHGEVDPRLLAILATLARLHSVDIIGFGSPMRGASAGVPLRSAEVTAAAPGSRRPGSLHSLMAVLRAQRPPYLPSLVEIVRISPPARVLRIEYPAPSPLGLLGSGR